MSVLLVDENCKHRDGKVYQDYSCTLNQTDIKTNKNKFYIIQIIEKDGKFYEFTRYGRVGEIGRVTCSECTYAPTGWFEGQFKTKTGNPWSSIKSKTFTPKKGKYSYCEVDYDDVDGLKDIVKDPTKLDAPEAASKLDVRVQNFLKLVTDTKTMDKTMISLDIDTKKLPLGKLSQSQIDKGYEILNSIKTKLKQSEGKTLTQSDKDEFMDMSSAYYTIIPYVCNRGSRPPVINTDEMVQKYTETLDELSNLTVAAKIVKDTTGSSDKNTLDAIYSQLDATIKPVEKDSDVWNIIQEYIVNTHAPTHSNYTVDLLDIYEVQRNTERDEYMKKFSSTPNKQLLWHGTRLTNYVSILQKGLLLRPDVIPGTYVTGKMFGYGIYAANSFSKSFNYTGADRTNPTACLFLAEVALGKTSNRIHSDYHISKQSLKMEGADSTWGQGQKTPGGYKTLPDGVIVPTGKLTSSGVPGATLLYDEFIVYDHNQLNLRYIVNVQGKFK